MPSDIATLDPNRISQFMIRTCTKTSTAPRRRDGDIILQMANQAQFQLKLQDKIVKK